MPSHPAHSRQLQSTLTALQSSSCARSFWLSLFIRLLVYLVTDVAHRISTMDAPGDEALLRVPFASGPAPHRAPMVLQVSYLPVTSDPEKNSTTPSPTSRRVTLRWRRQGRGHFSFSMATPLSTTNVPTWGPFGNCFLLSHFATSPCLPRGSSPKGTPSLRSNVWLDVPLWRPWPLLKNLSRSHLIPL